ncbi:PAS domain S-box protein [Aquibium oceanicum]|uniref:histidine kinase n=1 Tax=Aquibium oceanicum TaxID=1670800 RepID=A0A1L3SZ49_9HYPH|nr:PAS domain S-box protein [Aquibium oceanicum]APH74709.1 hypothetical protein BSQ44_19380 [Aquibium oceanicum]
MASSEYSFIDIAVLDAVRARFAAGEALAILSADLEEVIWANGPGARLFGYPDIEAIMGASAGLGFAQRRQIAATTGFPRIGSNRPLLVRLVSGVTSRAVSFLASSVTLPDGEAGILLAAPLAEKDEQDSAERASRAISGFTEAGYFAALLSGGEIVAATPGFQALGIEPGTVEDLVADVADAQDRLVKRLVPAASGHIPAGIARLTDEPGMHLLVAVDDPDLYRREDFFEAGSEPEAEALRKSEGRDEEADRAPSTGASVIGIAALTDQDDPANSGSADPATDAPAQVAEETTTEQRAGIDRWYFEADSASAEGQDEQDEVPAESTAEEAVEAVGEEQHLEPEEQPAAAAEETQPVSEHTGDVAAAPSPLPSAEHRNTAAVRFAWRTDASGNFSSISREFLEAVGGSEASVIGRSFAQVAENFGMDPDHEIAGLLERRDTWSGRTVLWPIEGTDLAAPVDLAALPVYARDRTFEGFRGFGIARLGDAVAAPRPLAVETEIAGEEDVSSPEIEDDASRADKERAESFGEFDEATDAEPATSEEPKTVTSAQEPPAPETREDPFRGEAPVIAIEEARYRRYSDKIIRLAEHRPNQPERALSPVERNAFREIGDRLKEVTQPLPRKPEPEAKREENAAETEEAPATTEADAPPAANDQVAPHVAEDDDATALPVTSDAATGLDGPETDAQPSAEEMPYLDVEEELFDEPLPAEQPAPDADAHEDGGAVLRDEVRGPTLPETVTFDGERLPARQAGQVFDGQAFEDRQVVEDVADPVAEVPETRDVDIEAASDVQPAQHAGHVFEGQVFENREVAEDAAGPVADAPEIDAADTESVSDVEPPEHAVVPAPDDDGETEAESDMVETGEFSGEAEESASEPQTEQPEPHQAAVLPFVPSAFSAPAGEGSRPDLDAGVLARLPLPLLIHRGDQLFFANRAFCELTGYASLEDLEASGGLGELFLEPYRSETETGEPAQGTVLSTKDGRAMPVRAHLQSIPWMGGKALLLALSPLETEQPLPAAAEPVEEPVAGFGNRVEEMRTILDTATDGVVLITPEGTIRSISHPAEALFGYEDKDVVGNPFAMLFAVESQRAARDYLQSLSEDGVASVLNDGREVIGREAQGRFIPLFMTIGRLPGGNGYCAVMRDITQWKRAEEELTHARAMAERASSQKSEFLARVSHEIRTPLNAIIGFSELMMDEKFGPMGNDRYRDYLRDINRSGNHVLDLVNDLLDISKIEAGEQEMAYEAVSLNDVLAETVAMMQPQANRERVIIRSSFASRLPEVVADLRSIRQIGLNLLSNAVRFTQPGGQVIVSTSCEATGDVVMRVRDTGVGMSAAEIEQALKPFKQINSLKRKRTDGTGLGLPLTKAMVEANRARFTINSTPGEGTLVEVTFPSARVLAG